MTWPDGRIRPSDRALALVTAGAASTSGVALLLDAYDVVGMPFTVSFLALPATLLILALAVWAGRVGRRAFLDRLYVGAVAGAAATAAYDIGRLIVAVSTPTDFDPFRAHPHFGALMLGVDPATPAAHAAGWVYHVWNGVSFAILYTMIAGGAYFFFAVVWALTLETAAIVTYPRFTPVEPGDVGFVAVSLFGHLIYGTTLGFLARNWLHAGRRDGWRLPWPRIQGGFT